MGLDLGTMGLDLARLASINKSIFDLSEVRVKGFPKGYQRPNLRGTERVPIESYDASGLPVLENPSGNPKF